MSLEANRRALEAWFERQDLDQLTEDVVFTDMATGRELRGREEVTRYLNWFWIQAFEAQAELVNLAVGEDAGALELAAAGKHVGEFEGVPATGREVRFHIAILYDFRDGKIKHARIYLPLPAILDQLQGRSKPD